MLRFESPWMFLLLLAIPLVFYWRSRRAARTALRFSNTAAARRAGTSLRQNLLPLPAVLRAGALILLAIALARPQAGTERLRDVSRGIAIEMVVDRSSSMGADMRFRGLQLNRLEVVKRVFHDFVDGAGELSGRPNDLIGMITFARYSDTICPLTLSHETLGELIKSVRLVDQRSEDGTAIGDAVSLAAARLRTAEEMLAKRLGEQPVYEIKSKVVILLTDGENNAGHRSIEEAAGLAKDWNVKVYAIGVGEDRGVDTPFGRVFVPKNPGVDDQALQDLATTTGGVYRLAADADSLVEIYEEIDRLERSEIEALRYLDYRELFVPFALAAAVLAAAEILLRSTFLRTAP